MTLKQGDFVTLDFTGTITESNTVFDTTIQTVAAEHGIQTQRMTYEPITICIGQGHVLPGLEQALEGKQAEETFRVTLAPENAFGKKRSDMLKLMPKKLFDKQEIRIQPGLQVTIDNMPGTIKSISGNRVVVDFNHQLAGHELSYEITTKGLVTDTQQQVHALVSMALHAPATIDIAENTATVTFPIELPEKLQTQLTETITEHTSVTEVAFKTPEAKA